MDKIEELQAMFGQAEYMKTAIDENTKEIAEEIRQWCVNEAHRLEKLQKDLCNFVFQHLKELTGRNLKSGFYYISTVGPLCYRYTNGTISFETKCENGIAVEVSDIGANCLGRIFTGASEGNSDIDHWVDAKRWLAIENERLNYFADELKKVMEELVKIQEKRFNRISNAHAEVAGNPKTMKVILEIRR